MEGEARKNDVPKEVEQFLVFFRMHLADRNISQISSIYEDTFPKLTERHFKNSPWPAVGVIAPIVENDEFLLMLYRELSFRHIHSHLHPSLQNQFDSWENYCNLFNHLLKVDPSSFEFPVAWLWALVDEFVYQFQFFSQFRGKMKTRSAEEKQLIKSHQQVWEVKSVIQYLAQFIEKVELGRISQIHKHDSIDDGKFSIHQYLGYFSLIGMARVHVMLGDYHSALQIVEPLELRKGGLYQKVLPAHVTLCYLVGFCHMMNQRFRDAIRAFNPAFVTVNRSKQLRSHDHITKIGDRMYALVAIAVSLSPHRLEEHVDTVLRERFSDKMSRIQQGHEGTYEDLFSVSCPKFVTINSDYSVDQPDFSQDTSKLQTKLFMQIVKQHSLIPVMRSYLKLYQTIPISKLADYLDMKEEEVCTQLISWKNRSQAVSRGESGEIHFWIDNGMVHVRAPKTQRRQADYFVTHITKMENILNDQKR